MAARAVTEVESHASAVVLGSRMGRPLAAAAVESPPRVLFVIYGLAPAGPELRLLDLARWLPPMTDVHICVVGDDLTLLEEFRKTGAKVTIVPVRRPYVEWRQIDKILAYIREHEISVVNSFDLKTLLVCAAIKLRYRSRVKLVHHLISLWEDVQFHQRAALWTALRCADRILCNGYTVKERVLGTRRLQAPSSVIPNGVDCEYFGRYERVAIGGACPTRLPESSVRPRHGGERPTGQELSLPARRHERARWPLPTRPPPLCRRRTTAGTDEGTR